MVSQADGLSKKSNRLKCSKRNLSKNNKSTETRRRRKVPKIILPTPNKQEQISNAKKLERKKASTKSTQNLRRNSNPNYLKSIASWRPRGGFFSMRSEDNWKPSKFKRQDRNYLAIAIGKALLRCHASPAPPF